TGRGNHWRNFGLTSLDREVLLRGSDLRLTWIAILKQDVTAVPGDLHILDLLSSSIGHGDVLGAPLKCSEASKPLAFTDSIARLIARDQSCHALYPANGIRSRADHTSPSVRVMTLRLSSCASNE